MKLGEDRGAATRRVKEWAREVFDAADATVLVSQLACTEPGCPPLETVIAVLRGPGHSAQYKVHRPLVEVTREDLVSAREHPHR